MIRLILAILVTANIATALAVVHARHQHRLLFGELTQQERARDELNVVFSQLQLEQAMWAESNRTDQVARSRLGMRLPEADEIVVVRP